MSSFALRYPFFILMACMVIVVIGTVNLLGMPVDLFPEVKIPVVVVATFYSGMPPQQIEADITDTFERFFTLGSGIDHIESRSMTGVSLIKIYFQAGTDPNADVSSISNLAMADLRRLPPGTLPPVVLSFNAANLPVCLITLQGQGLSETKMKDIGQFEVRNQVASVAGASVPQPYGGRYRQIMVYVDPLKLEANGLSVSDVYKAINQSNLILPAGDVRIGPKDYNIYANSQVAKASDANDIPLKTSGNSSILVGDIGHAEDGGQLQYNIVRVNGQHSVYVPIFKQGGNSNTIKIVDGVRDRVKHLLDVPPQLKARVVFDQSIFVKLAVHNVIREGGLGLVLTGLMILLFLGNVRATVAVMLSIPISVLAAFLLLNVSGNTVNTMVLGGLALALSRLIDNSVVVLENIFRHMEMGEPVLVAAEQGGKEVDLAVLASTVTTSIVFFPVVLLAGVSKYLFSAMALAVVLALLASYLVAMTVVPLYCAKFISFHGEGEHDDADATASGTAIKAYDPAEIAQPLESPPQQGHLSPFQYVVQNFNAYYQRVQRKYDETILYCLDRPVAVVVGFTIFVVVSLALYPFVGVAFFPRTDPGQFVINIKAPAGTRLELTDQYCARIEQIIRQQVRPADLNMIVSNIGVYPDLSAIYTSNTAMDTAFIQVSLKEDHKIGSYTYMQRVREQVQRQIPEVQAFFQAGGLVNSIVNQGKPAPFDIRVSTQDFKDGNKIAQEIASRARQLHDVSDVLVPQDIDYPGLKLNIDRQRAAILGLTVKDVVDSVITALTSNGQVAPTYWIDPKSGNNYMLTVQYYESQIQSLKDFKEIPLRASSPPEGTPLPHASEVTPLEAVADVHYINTPTVIDHYKLRRVFDVYVMPTTEDLGHPDKELKKIVADMHPPHGTLISIAGSINDMHASFRSFGVGLILAIILVYLILMAQFASFSDPFVILLAVPPGAAGVLLTLLATHTSINIMSLMGVLMTTGIVVSNSILIVQFVAALRDEGKPLKIAVAQGCQVRLRPILMTALATVLGMIPMALGVEAGSEQYAPLARAILGGLLISTVVSIFLVPAAYYLIHRKEENEDGTPRNEKLKNDKPGNNKSGNDKPRGGAVDLHRPNQEAQA
ncbi:MAG TPA: efflux RND transporter permease subunit [Acidobacteriaceae bacterium]|jgi:multidrug efflux pump subunit AcrB|nr:efflux RND transporter permease subunit [Acidobacteriaceae bacterium]